MYRLESSNTNLIGPQKATDLLKLNTFDGQRPIQREHVVRLRNLINSEHFVKGQVAIAKYNGSEQLVNGQHQLHAVAEAGKVVKFTVDYYVCDEASDMWHLFSTFDVNRVRTERHIMQAARGLFENEKLRELPFRLLAVCGSALHVVSTSPPQILRTSPSKTAKAELVEQYADEVLWVNDLLSACGRVVPVVPIVASILMTYRACPEKAVEFWTPILTSSELVRGSPQWKCHRHINDELLATSSPRSKAFSLMAGCIAWWNSWITNSPRVIVKIAGMKQVPEALGQKK